MGRFSPLADAADADLAARAAAGDNAAFEELYRRHAEAAWRVAQAVTRNRDDAADAVSDAFTRVLQALPEGRLRDGASFRAYLLTAARRAGIDQLRRRGRQQPGDVSALADQPTGSASPTEKLLQATDAALVAAAFRNLPERWRSVLWLTEVERIPAKEAAPILGMSPNGVAQLAVRARNGLRERYIQAHLRDGAVDAECRFTVERLGAYVAAALSPRDLAKVDQHLAGCEPCRARHAELEELGDRLRRVLIPLPIGLGGIVLKNWRFHAGHSVTGKAAKTAALAAKAERPLAVVTATLFAAGIAGVGLVGRGPGTPPAAAHDGGGRDAAASKVVVEQASSRSDAATALVPTAEDLSRERRNTTRPHTTAGTGADGSNGSNTDGLPSEGTTTLPPAPPPPPPPKSPDPNPPPAPPPAPAPAAQLQVTVSGGGTVLSVAAGQGDGSCTGGSFAGQSAGCVPPPPNSDAILTVSTGGSAVPVEGQREIGLP